MCLINVIKTYRNSFTSWIGRNFLFSWDWFLTSLLSPKFVSHRVWSKEIILFSSLFSRNLKNKKEKQTPIWKADPNQEPVHHLEDFGAVNDKRCLSARTPSGHDSAPLWSPSHMEALVTALLLPCCSWGNTVYHSPCMRLVISHLHLSVHSSPKYSTTWQPLPPFL